jgi:hypothetical protein
MPGKCSFNENGEFVPCDTMSKCLPTIGGSNGRNVFGFIKIEERGPGGSLVEKGIKYIPKGQKFGYELKVCPFCGEKLSEE